MSFMMSKFFITQSFYKFPITILVRSDSLNDRSIQLLDMSCNSGTTDIQEAVYFRNRKAKD